MLRCCSSPGPYSLSNTRHHQELKAIPTLGSGIEEQRKAIRGRGRPPKTEEQRQHERELKLRKAKRDVAAAVRTSGTEALFLGERILPEVSLPMKQYDRAAAVIAEPELGKGPRGLSDELEHEFLGYIMLGANISTAAYAAGLLPDTVNRWMREGERGNPNYAAFYSRVRITENQYKTRLLYTMIETDDRNWTRIAWLLERKFKDEFALRGQDRADDAGKQLADASARLAAIKAKREGLVADAN